MFIWIVSLIFIATISLFLTLRSMRKFEDLEQNLVPQSLFLIRNAGEFHQQLLENLHTWAAQERVTFSVERLFKGGEQALVIYGPMTLPEVLPGLDLLELEDYLTVSEPPDPLKTNIHQILGFTIPLSANLGFVRASFLDTLTLDPDEKFYWQIVVRPIPIPEETKDASDLNPHFQVIARCLIVEENAQKRVDLAKKILPGLQEDFLAGQGDNKPLAPQNATTIFQPYLSRSLELGHKGEHYLNGQEVLALLNLN